MTHLRCTAGRGIPSIVVGVALCVLAISGEARAQGGRQLSEKAQAHYERGQAAYEKGDYARAAEELRKAYSLASVPMLLYNISLAEWRAGNLEAATATALRARRAGLPDRPATRNSARLAAFGVVRTARDASPASTATSGRTERGTTGKRRAEAGRAFGTLGWIGVGLVGGGVASLGGAVWFDERVDNAVGKMQRARRTGDAAEANRILRDEVRPDQTVGRVLLASGTALAATGAALVIVDLVRGTGSSRGTSPPRSASAVDGPNVTPMLAADTVGLQLRFAPAALLVER